MSFKGLGFKLSDDELRVLSAFRDENEIAFPVGCGLSVSETLNIMQQLIRKDIVVGRGPYRLTKLGKRLKESMSQ